MNIPPIALVAFGAKVENLRHDQNRVVEFLRSENSEERAGAVALLVTQFHLPKVELLATLNRFLQSESSPECRAHAMRYLAELNRDDRRNLSIQEVSNWSEESAIDRFLSSNDTIKIAVVNYTESDCKWNDSTRRMVCTLAYSDLDENVRLAAMHTMARPHFGTSSSKEAKRFALLALDEQELENIRVFASMMVYQIFRPKTVIPQNPNYGEYVLLDHAYVERVRRVITQRTLGIDSNFMRDVAESEI